jgi:DNA-binding response OmpR family regulator
MQMAKILLMTDEVTALSPWTAYLAQAGYQVVYCPPAQDGLKAAFQEQPELIILDVGRSPLAGVPTCRRFRALIATPIMLVTARADKAALIRGLEAGADAYVVKSCSPRLVVAKIAALLRRSSPPPALPAPYADGYLELDWPHEQVRVQGQAVPLTATEFRLLAYLVRQADRVVPYAELRQGVWGAARLSDPRTLCAAMCDLRRKIEPDPPHPSYLKTVRGIGYRFEPGASPPLSGRPTASSR